MSRILGGFETILLFALLELDDDAYGVAIRKAIKARTRRTVSPGAVHTALLRLERRGLVQSETDETPPKSGGRPRRYYELTEEGARALRGSHAAITQMAAGLEARLRNAAPGPERA
ncbi:MAG: PadR family transcriptional regulator [Longimicrobiales bacterium]